MDTRCRPKPLQSTFCSKTFDYPHALNTVPVINFFGDKQRFRSRKNKPVAALQQCQSLLDNSKVYAEHTWQAPNEMQVANRKSLTFLPDDTGAPWHPGQCQVSNRIVVALMVVMLLAAMNVSRWPGTHEHASKSALASRVDINAVAHT